MPPEFNVCVGILPFAVGPPEQLGVLPLVTLFGCVNVKVQFKKPSLVLLNPFGIAILKTKVRNVSVLTVAYFSLLKPESLLENESNVPCSNCGNVIMPS